LTQAIIDWLPPSTLVDPRIKDMLIDEISRWSARWFGDRMPHTLVKFEALGKARQAIPSSGEWTGTVGGLACFWNEKTMIQFARRIIDADDSRYGSGGHDNELLLALAKNAIDDLARKIVGANDLLPDSPFDAGVLERSGGVQLTVGAKQKTDQPIRLALPMAVASRLRKSLIRSGENQPALKGNLADAFDQEQVQVAVRLGNARMAAQTLCDLSLGDVVLLDTQLEDSFPMISGKNGQEICRLTLARDGKETTLCVAEL
jgi:flagellar motor switch/type III secretory pathway protein FliN